MTSAGEKALDRIAAALEGLLNVQRERLAFEKEERAKTEAFRQHIAKATERSSAQSEVALKQQARATEIMKQALPPPEPWQERGEQG